MLLKYKYTELGQMVRVTGPCLYVNCRLDCHKMFGKNEHGKVLSPEMRHYTCK